MKKIISILLALAGIGLAASIYLTQLDYKISAQGIQERSACQVSDFFDCNTALTSPYSKIWIFPISEFGILYYTIFIAGFFYAWGSQKNRDKTLLLLWVSSFFALLSSLALLFLSVITLHSVCLVCSSTYIVNFLTFLLIPMAMTGGYASLKSHISSYLDSFSGSKKDSSSITHLLGFLGFVALVSTLGLLSMKGQAPEAHREKPQIDLSQFEVYLGKYAQQPIQSIPLNPHNPTWGSANPKVTIIEFSDLQCPFCRLAAFNIKPYLKPYRNDVRLIFKNYPLDNACNPSLPQPMHPVACLAAKAGICAQKEGKFWDYHDLVFENQKRLSRSTLIELADEVGLNRESFEKCLISEETAQLLKQDIDDGVQASIHGTPAVFVNGRPFNHWTIPDVLKRIIEAEKNGEVNRAAPPTSQPMTLPTNHP